MFLVFPSCFLIPANQNEKWAKTDELWRVHWKLPNVWEPWDRPVPLVHVASRVATTGGQHWAPASLLSFNTAEQLVRCIYVILRGEYCGTCFDWLHPRVGERKMFQLLDADQIKLALPKLTASSLFLPFFFFHDCPLRFNSNFSGIYYCRCLLW